MPTVFADVDNRMKIAQDEIFGPVACLIPFEDEADAIRLANDIQYGLSSYVWTENLGRAHRVAAAVEAGMCFVNSQNVRDLRQPFGGTKASGTGREGGTWSYEVFLRAEERRGVAGLAPHPALGTSDRLGRQRWAPCARRQDHPRAVDVPVASSTARTTAAAQAAIDGHNEIGRRCRELGVDTIVVFDVHWLVNSEYHINCAPQFKGVYTSNELPHFIKNMPYAYPGNPALGHLIGDMANAHGREEPRASRHHAGAGVRHAGADALHERRPALQGGVGVSGWCMWHELDESARFGLRGAPGDRGAATTARWRCSPAARCRTTSPTTAARPSSCTRSRTRSSSRWTARVVELWERGDWKTFIGMLPMYADKCWGEGDMHDTAMLLGLLGWDATTQRRRRDRHAVLRQLGHRADQRDLSGDAAGSIGISIGI